jgi:hypothetical protein
MTSPAPATATEISHISTDSKLHDNTPPSVRYSPDVEMSIFESFELAPRSLEDQVKLVFQSSSPLQERHAALTLLVAVIGNVVKRPDDTKFRRVNKRKTVPRFNRAVGVVALTHRLGFVDTGDFLELAETAASSIGIERLNHIHALLNNAMQAESQLDSKRKELAVGLLAARASRKVSKKSSKSRKLKAASSAAAQNQTTASPTEQAAAASIATEVKAAADLISQPFCAFDMDWIHDMRAKYGEVGRFEWTVPQWSKKDNMVRFKCPVMFKDSIAHRMFVATATKTSTGVALQVACVTTKLLPTQPAKVHMHAYVLQRVSKLPLDIGSHKASGAEGVCLFTHHQHEFGWKEFATMEQLTAFGAFNSSEDKLTFRIDIVVGSPLIHARSTE